MSRASAASGVEGAGSGEFIKVHALVTPSHATLLHDWFLRTLPAECQPVIHERDAQPVQFASGEWHRVVGQKLEIVLDALATIDRDDFFVMSDVDVCFYNEIAGDLRSRMSDRDVLFQNNRPTLSASADNICSGFMVIRASPGSREFFERARDVMQAADDPAVGDQRACIETLRAMPDLIRWGFLPITYWSPGDPRGRWVPGMSLRPPEGLILHHANHTVGVENKVAQLRLVAASVANGAAGRLSPSAG